MAKAGGNLLNTYVADYVALFNTVNSAVGAV